MIRIRDESLSIWLDSWCKGNGISRKKVYGELLVKHLMANHKQRASLEAKLSTANLQPVRCLMDGDGNLINPDGSRIKPSEFVWTSDDRRKMNRLEAENAEIKMLYQNALNKLESIRTKLSFRERVIKSFKILIGME